MFIEPAQDLRLKRANANLWRIADLVAASDFIIGHSRAAEQNPTEIKILEGILCSILALADVANDALIEFMDEPMFLGSDGQPTPSVVQP